MDIRIKIGGCRDYRNYESFCKHLDAWLNEARPDNVTILSGHCSGVDEMAERFAEERGYILEVYPAEWERYGIAAGPIRNKTMVRKSDEIIAFWDYKSKGTRNLIDITKRLKKPLHIIDISEKQK